jgi:hypothetical protein
MKRLIEAEQFGGTDADNDDILLQAFEDHEAYLRREFALASR